MHLGLPAGHTRFFMKGMLRPSVSLKGEFFMDINKECLTLS